MKTQHRIHFTDASDLKSMKPKSLHLVVTSPPYPMIELWDEVFSKQDPSIGDALRKNDGWSAFNRMHKLLDAIWKQVHRVLVDGGIACINIGDATRTISECFTLYPNHSRILGQLAKLGFNPLPTILWRKQTNAPNKFMGSGMFPPGAYVTLEHEYVLIVRKGDKRVFGSPAGLQNRRESAFFWEERNNWYSDVWFDLKGSRQSLVDKAARDRSGAFPFELAYRLISMFSVKGDTVLDPFLGTGTTTLAAMAAGRNSVGYELDPSFSAVIREQTGDIVSLANARIKERLSAHADFVRERYETKGTFGYPNRHYGFPVVTRQERDLLLNRLISVKQDGTSEFEVTYSRSARAKADDWRWFFEGGDVTSRRPTRETGKRKRDGKDAAPGDKKIIQLDLLS